MDEGSGYFGSDGGMSVSDAVKIANMVRTGGGEG